jgi:hypothetical protein
MARSANLHRYYSETRTTRLTSGRHGRPLLPPAWSLMELPQIIPVPLEWSAVARFVSGSADKRKPRSSYQNRSGGVIQTFIADGWDGGLLTRYEAECKRGSDWAYVPTFGHWMRVLVRAMLPFSGTPVPRGHCLPPPAFPGETAVAPTLSLVSRDFGSATVLRG